MPRSTNSPRSLAIYVHPDDDKVGQDGLAASLHHDDSRDLELAAK